MQESLPLNLCGIGKWFLKLSVRSKNNSINKYTLVRDTLPIVTVI